MRIIKYVIYIILFVALVFASTDDAVAANAYLYFKNRINPLYIQNIEFYYYKSLIGNKSIVILLEDQGKYHEFKFERLRDIEFKRFIGARYLRPIFRIRIFLKENAHFLDASLMPLRKITGFYNGRSWSYNLTIVGDNYEKVMNVDKIHFVQPF